MQQVQVERSEEEKLRKKYPGITTNASSLLQRRLSKNAKFFDSGDYNMAKSPQARHSSEVPTGDTIPTPENIPTVRNRAAHSHFPSVCVETGTPTAPVATSHQTPSMGTFSSEPSDKR
ncbi:unnamed protein product [Calicophoron daubneyi]|uniref:cAMP-regulated phosphoprotein 19 n=1 Tax=Calicophoron daubneyi TaxID=300641 RepID=A0AAV2TUV5_CALDB